MIRLFSVTKNPVAEFLEGALYDPYCQWQNNGEMLKKVSEKINSVASLIFYEMRSCLWQAPEHAGRVFTLGYQKSQCGATKQAPALFPNASAFEQMIAVENWFFNRKPLERTTFCLAATHPLIRNKKIPCSLNSGSQSLMELKIGNTGKNTPAPVYERNWDTNDPWMDEKNWQSCDLLESLEAVRQPAYIGAGLVKANLFTSEVIGPEWRYGTVDQEGNPAKTASVEFRGQRTLTKKKQEAKAQSAAFNLLKINSVLPIELSKELNICAHAEDYNLFGEIFTLNVTPYGYIRALIDEFQYQSPHSEIKIYYQTLKMMLALFGDHTTPRLNEFIFHKLRECKEKVIEFIDE